MIRMCFYMFMAIFLLMSKVWGAARTCGQDLITITSKVGEMTEIEVENGIADLIRSGDPASLKVEHASGHLFITPLTINPAELSIIDERGKSYRIRHVSGDRVSDKIVIADCDTDHEKDSRAGALVGFLRGLVSGRLAETSVAKKADRIIFSNEQWQVRVIEDVERPPLLAYVALVKNLGKFPALIPLERFHVRGLVAVTSLKDMLEPLEETKIFLVIKP